MFWTRPHTFVMLLVSLALRTPFKFLVFCFAFYEERNLLGCRRSIHWWLGLLCIFLVFFVFVFKLSVFSKTKITLTTLKILKCLSFTFLCKGWFRKHENIFLAILEKFIFINFPWKLKPVYPTSYMGCWENETRKQKTISSSRCFLFP